MCKQFVRRVDRGLVEHLDKPAINLCLYGILCIFGIQHMYGKSSSSSLVYIPKETRTDLWLSSNSDADKIRKIACRAPSEWVPCEVHIPLSRCWRNVSCRQMYSCWMIYLRGLRQNSHGDGNKKNLKIFLSMHLLLWMHFMLYFICMGFA